MISPVTVELDPRREAMDVAAELHELMQGDKWTDQDASVRLWGKMKPEFEFKA